MSSFEHSYVSLLEIPQEDRQKDISDILETFFRKVKCIVLETANICNKMFERGRKKRIIYLKIVYGSHLHFLSSHMEIQCQFICMCYYLVHSQLAKVLPKIIREILTMNSAQFCPVSRHSLQPSRNVGKRN